MLFFAIILKGGLRNRFYQEKAPELSMKSFFVVTSYVTVYRIPPFCEENMFYDLKKNKKYKEKLYEVK